MTNYNADTADTAITADQARWGSPGKERGGTAPARPRARYRWQLSTELLRYAKGTVEVGPVVLHMDVDDQLLARITKRLKALPA